MSLQEYYELGVKQAFMEKVSGSNKNENRAKAVALGAIAAPVAANLGAVGLAAGGSALENKLTPGGAAGNDMLQGLRSHMNVDPRVSVEFGGQIRHPLMAHYDPRAKAVRVAHKTPPSLLAHELGHASGKPILGWGGQAVSRKLAPLLALAGTAGQAWTDPDSTATNVLRYGPAVAAAPTFAEEVRATTRGMKGLHRTGGKGAALKGLLSLLPALGTYGLAATSPIWGGKLVQHLANKD